MKITYDKKIDAMYLHFQEGTFSRNKEVEDGIILDIGKGNKILGIEILNASKRIKPKGLDYLDFQIPIKTLA
ncbi:MAG: hypothetical protein UT65_C0032G0010 [Parcubacteria group bacterium GW2011_GWF2_39_8b]|uniref:DUF2283 domain-containing protein n=3 Tax=Candidatus Zambryskiibacteriota TaxID=1817925 RepID=A0A1G2T6G0_9BACT|nr:MAG: hypothetical protein UT65_C0032G0010 [Parcubacteria group bacterium GW2011_GWF2_39_8b]KKR45924.1 MAG: hypothetical protein UT81_C0004G0022 [Parcubacteria group bacterium GW2011_GWA2_40_14]OHA92752.1 MAG: hypothetical protein A2W58_03180 [Candidatus Zambryskibacteria bacterium RIFCSPHIGHO2_02_38_10.5]OHA97096.1 MAG: hypothetical protein A3C63_00910 [Candidatus Zambryskibacteria bacterium RIFCSPHIGHO2_02_FULL_39_82]OHA99750.1 MAG: hypothetical protein A3E32_00755 [Candidatus Zambryskibact